MKRLLCLTLLLLLMLTACAAPAATFTGTIQSVTGQSVMIESIEDDQSFDIASVSVTDQTKIILEDGTKGSVSDLQEGWKVTVTFDGTVRESYPVQITADKITVNAVG